MPKAKKFIDKKKAVSFQLVHRSQQDPLVVDEDAPQMVLIPKPNLNQERKYGNIDDFSSQFGDYMDDPEHVPHLKNINDNQMEWPEHVDQELAELAERRKKIEMQLPPEVFPSRKEEKEGMLSKAAPGPKLQLNLDPDLVAAMDEDFDFNDEDNQLEDNFIELADGLASDEEIGSEFELRSDDDVDEMDDDVDSLHSFEQEERKSRFTNYSMSSSVIRRNEQLQLLDQRFEKAFEEYDEEKLGAIEGEEITGHIPPNSDYLLGLATEYHKEQERLQLDTENDEELKLRTLKLFENQGEDKMVLMEIPQPLPYDCETIISTYSNKYNRPRTIVVPKPAKIKVHNRTGVPLDVLDENQVTEKRLQQLMQMPSSSSNNTAASVKESVISQLSELSIRPKDETPEERRIRKQNVKAYMRERREEKKANREAFKQESIQQAKIKLNEKHNRQNAILTDDRTLRVH